MIDLNGKFTVSEDTITKIVEEEISHKDYDTTCERARVMNSWYKAEDDTATSVLDASGSKSTIIKRSSIESEDDYAEKLQRMRLFALEKKFFESQQRIYDENNVNRRWPDATKDFWEYKTHHFDDAGDSIDVFFRDKVLFVKEVLGWGAAVQDLMIDDAGKVIHDSKNNVVPYSYTIRPEELFNYQIR